MIIRDATDLNYIVINGFTSPGRVRVDGASIPTKWRIPKSFGQTGASYAMTGRKPSDFTLTFEMWTQEQLIEWDVFKKLLDPPKPFTPPNLIGVGVSHPILKEVGIEACVITDRGALTLTRGLWTAVVKCTEFRPMKPGLTKKAKSPPPAASGNPWTAQSAAGDALVTARVEFEASKAKANGT